MKHPTYKIVTVIIILVKIVYSSTIETDSLTRDLKPLTFEDCKKFIGKDGFRSKEELLQIFFNAYFDGSVRNVWMKTNEILALSKSINTLFPLKNCTSIESIDSLLILKFIAPQTVTVPGSFRLANLQMSDKIAFVLSHTKNKAPTLNFRIVEGHVNLRISGLLKFFSKQMSNMNGTSLFYSANPRSKTSVIGLVEEDTIPAEKMKVSGTEHRISIDIDIPQYNSKEDIVITENELTFLTIDFKIQGYDSIMYNNDKWQKDSLAVSNIKTLITQVQKDFSENRPFPEGILINKNAVYQLEKRRMSLSTGFYPPQKENKP